MCNCTSCKYTDSFSAKGFAEWPTGAPKGARKAKAEYSAHVAFGARGTGSRIEFNPGAAPVYPAWVSQGVHVTPYPARMRAYISKPRTIEGPQTEEAI